MDAVLRLDNVTKVFGRGATAVRAVDSASLTAGKNEIVLVMGPSGSGKTTLLAMCGALLSPTAGRVRLGRADITAFSQKELARLRLRSIGFVFQSFNLLLNLTALENVRVVMEAAGVRRRTADVRVRELLAELRLSDRVDYLPEKLSAGERQRVAIARALANDAPLILADEPTGNLDSKTGYQVMHLLEGLAKERGKTVVAVTHDHRIEHVADRVLWLEDGHLSDTAPEASRLARDPVCGMSINVTRAAGSRRWVGTEFHFCSESCLERFDAEPARYGGAPG
jgi:putative ABC transport system ATP-binding protein